NLEVRDAEVFPITFGIGTPEESTR
ncbi:MAG: hypothetical protein QOF01_3746, partial [Thermomicrobiales bacterium]|nr:hypothetical protein [Thermomicrobiales bacterium]